MTDDATGGAGGDAPPGKPEAEAGVTPAGAFVAGVERAQTVFARLALAALLFFLGALVAAPEARGFLGFLMLFFFALYVVSLFITVFGRKPHGHEEATPGGNAQAHPTGGDAPTSHDPAVRDRDGTGPEGGAP